MPMSPLAMYASPSGLRPHVAAPLVDDVDDLVAVEDRLRAEGPWDLAPPALGGRHLAPSAAKPFLDHAVQGVDAVKTAAHGRQHLPGLGLAKPRPGCRRNWFQKNARSRSLKREPPSDTSKPELVVRPREFERRAPAPSTIFVCRSCGSFHCTSRSRAALRRREPVPHLVRAGVERAAAEVRREQHVLAVGDRLPAGDGQLRVARARSAGTRPRRPAGASSFTMSTNGPARADRRELPRIADEHEALDVRAARRSAPRAGPR